MTSEKCKENKKSFPSSYHLLLEATIMSEGSFS